MLVMQEKHFMNNKSRIKSSIVYMLKNISISEGDGLGNNKRNTSNNT
jgi:hypothetical protein